MTALLPLLAAAAVIIPIALADTLLGLLIRRRGDRRMWR